MDVIEKINSDLEGLPIIEKLEYWFSKVYPEQLDDGREEVSFAMRYFGTTKLIETVLGYIPLSIFDNHFANNDGDQEYQDYIADRAAKKLFLLQKSSFIEDFEMYGEGYVNKILKKSEDKLNRIFQQEREGEKDRVIQDKIYHKKYLIPFCKRQIAKNRPPEFKTLDEAVSKEEKAFMLRALEYLKITKEGICILSIRQKSKLRGFVEALIVKGIFPNRNIDNLIAIIADEIKMQLNARLKKTNLSKEMEKRTLNYIRNNHL